MQNILGKIYATSTHILPSQAYGLPLIADITVHEGPVFIHFEFMAGCTIVWTTWCQVATTLDIYSFTSMIQKMRPFSHRAKRSPDLDINLIRNILAILQDNP